MLIYLVSVFSLGNHRTTATTKSTMPSVSKKCNYINGEGPRSCSIATMSDKDKIKKYFKF